MANQARLSPLVTMTTKHLSTGSACPPLGDGVMRCYNMTYCPYAQRTRLVLAAKNVTHEIVNVNLITKPEWLFEKNPFGKVPILEQNGRCIYESLITCDYLDEVYPEPPLYPADPLKKAEDRMFIERISQITTPLYKLYYSKEDEQTQKSCDDIKSGLDVFENELVKRGSEFFCGGRPGMLDYMIWPWMERLPMVQMFAGNAGIIIQDRFPKLLSWMDTMKKDAAVKVSFISPETHFKFIKTHLNGSPDYDMEQ
ncbi:pyrimidodiazepine synthase isoform X1 [Procambarus clarkii]|nr:pyrimidodiazepine synthase-like isoform X1 [Procambarus clarkii]